MAAHDDPADGWQLGDTGPEAYERYLVPGMFAPWAETLLERCHTDDGSRVLDVACGTGIVARRAAPRVGAAGRVVGVDLNEAMLAVARTSSADSGQSIDWQQADATDLPFPEESFDVACCQQALQFVADPAAALREMHRVLVPDGSLAVSVWRPLDCHSTYAVMADALDRHVGATAGATMRSPFPDWDRSTLRTLVGDAGFRDVELSIEIGSMRYPSVEEFLRREAASSPLADRVREVESAVRSSLLADLTDSLAGYTDDRGVVFPMEAVVAVGRR